MNSKAVVKWTGWLLMIIMLFMAFTSYQLTKEERTAVGHHEAPKQKSNQGESQDAPPFIPSVWYVSTAHAPGVLLASLQVKPLPQIALIPIPLLAFNQTVRYCLIINRFRFRDLMLSAMSISTRPFRAP